MVEEEIKPPVVQTPPGGINKDQEVTLPAETLQRILKQLDDQAAAIAILRDSVSQGKLVEAENKGKPAELPIGYLKVFQGKTVIGWKAERGEVIRHPQNPDVIIGENLKARYFFLEGGDSGIVDQIDFTNTEDRVIVRLVQGKDILKQPGLTLLKIKCEKLVTADGNEDLKASYKVPTEEMEIHKNFLNP